MQVCVVGEGGGGRGERGGRTDGGGALLHRLRPCAGSGLADHLLTTYAGGGRCGWVGGSITLQHGVMWFLGGPGVVDLIL